MNTIQTSRSRWGLVVLLTALPLFLIFLSPAPAYADLCISIRETGTRPLMPLIDTALERSRTHQAHIERALRRAQSSGWLPEISLYARHGQAEDTNLRPSGMGMSSDREVRMGVELNFDLRRVLYPTQTTVLLRQSANALRAARSLTERIVELVFQRVWN